MSPSSRPPRRKVLVKSRAPEVLLRRGSTSPTRPKGRAGRSSSGLRSGDAPFFLRTTSPTGTVARTETKTGAPIKLRLSLPKSSTSNSPFNHATNPIARTQPGLSLQLNRTGGSANAPTPVTDVDPAQVYNTSRSSFSNTPDTRARSPSTSPGAIRPLSLSSKNGSAWTSTARTPPRLGHNSIPAALRPSHVSAAEHMFAQRVAQAAAARAISLSPRSAHKLAQEQHLRTKMLQLQQTQQAEQQHVVVRTDTASRVTGWGREHEKQRQEAQRAGV